MRWGREDIPGYILLKSETFVNLCAVERSDPRVVPCVALVHPLPPCAAGLHALAPLTHNQMSIRNYVLGPHIRT